MSAAASINVGNRTESNVTNSTVNESVFSVNNCTNIVNTLNQETVIIVDAEAGATQKIWNDAKLTIKNSTFNVGGEYNEVNLGAVVSGKQLAKIVAQCSGVVAHSADLTDAMMYSISTSGESMQFSEMMSAAKAIQTTECSSSGLLSLSVSVGVNNSVVSNVNNSIKNLFKMAISNYMSSETRRNLLLKNITESQAIVNQSMENKALVSLDGAIFNITGKKNKVNGTAIAEGSSEASIDTKVESSAKSLTSAITDIAVSSTTDVTSTQTAISKAEATADGSTKVSSDSGLDGSILIVLAIIAGVVSICTVGFNAWAKAKACGNRRNGKYERLNDNDMKAVSDALQSAPNVK